MAHQQRPPAATTSYTAARTTDDIAAGWRGDTATASAMRRGYQQLTARFGVTHIVGVRGDNYCGIRAVLLGLLGNSPTHLQDAALAAASRIDSAFGECPYLADWSFARRLKTGPGVSTKARITDAMQELIQLAGVIADTPAESRADRAFKLINELSLDGGVREILLLEAIKFIMFCKSECHVTTIASDSITQCLLWTCSRP